VFDLAKSLDWQIVPTLIIQGDDDQIVPFSDAGLLQSKLVKGDTPAVLYDAEPSVVTVRRTD